MNQTMLSQSEISSPLPANRVGIPIASYDICIMGAHISLDLMHFVESLIFYRVLSGHTFDRLQHGNAWKIVLIHNY